MSLSVAVQMDPIENIDIAADSTFALMLEAQARGHVLDTRHVYQGAPLPAPTEFEMVLVMGGAMGVYDSD